MKNKFFLVHAEGLGPSTEHFLGHWQRENPGDVLRDVTSRSMVNDALVLEVGTNAEMYEVFETAKRVETAVTGNMSCWSVRLHYRLKEETSAGIPAHYSLPPAHPWKS